MAKPLISPILSSKVNRLYLSLSLSSIHSSLSHLTQPVSEIWFLLLALIAKWAGRWWAVEATRRFSQCRSGRRWSIKPWFSSTSRPVCLFLPSSWPLFAAASISCTPISFVTPLVRFSYSLLYHFNRNQSFCDSLIFCWIKLVVKASCVVCEELQSSSRLA